MTSPPLVYEITECVGDMDNNGVIDFDDIAPFIDCVVAGGCPTDPGQCGGDDDGGERCRWRRRWRGDEVGRVRDLAQLSAA